MKPRFPTQTDLAFYQSKRLPPWASKLRAGPQIPVEMIDLVVAAHAGVHPTSGELETINLLSIVRSWQRRGVNVVAGLRELIDRPGCLISPRKRSSLARKWAARLEAS